MASPVAASVSAMIHNLTSPRSVFPADAVVKTIRQLTAPIPELICIHQLTVLVIPPAAIVAAIHQLTVPAATPVVADPVATSTVQAPPVRTVAAPVATPTAPVRFAPAPQIPVLAPPAAAAAPSPAVAFAPAPAPGGPIRNPGQRAGRKPFTGRAAVVNDTASGLGLTTTTVLDLVKGAMSTLYRRHKHVENGLKWMTKELILNEIIPATMHMSFDRSEDKWDHRVWLHAIKPALAILRTSDGGDMVEHNGFASSNTGYRLTQQYRV